MKPKKRPASKTNWARVLRMRDEDIDTSDIPEIDEKTLAGGVVRVAGKIIPSGKRKRPPAR